jgi:putative cardiolipin synthase
MRAQCAQSRIDRRMFVLAAVWIFMRPEYLGVFARPLMAIAFAAAMSACSSLRPDFAKPPSSALPPTTDTSSARYIAGELSGRGDQSGFRLLTRSTNALMSRVALADHAKHSIDLQYYIFQNDATGRLLAQRLLAAADRGVRVRMLLDDVNLKDEGQMLDALDAHENIEVRLFNPFRTREPSLLSKVGQFLLEGRRLNRRMHNKSFIVDNSVAIIGGRNIGDDYFDAGNDTNFRDLDLVAIGPVVPEASHVFDDYWNCDAAYPVTAFSNHRDTHADLAALRIALARDARAFAQSDYAQAALDEIPGGPTADRHGEWFWGPAMLVADEPEKINVHENARALSIGPKLKAMVEAARSEVIMTSPYFVPGESGTRFLTEVAQRGVSVRVLTNSLASTDEPAVHSGYARYRRQLLEGGVQLHELRPAPGAAQPATAGGTSSGVSLHAKALVVDRQYVFIGSLNMDQRSKLLNTEMGLIVDSTLLAQAVREFFDTATHPENAFAVVLRESPPSKTGQAKMTWQWSEDGHAMSDQSDPGVSAKRRLEVFVMRLLPIEGLL